MYTSPLVTTNTERTVKLYNHLHMQQAKRSACNLTQKNSFFGVQKGEQILEVLLHWYTQQHFLSI